MKRSKSKSRTQQHHKGSLQTTARYKNRDSSIQLSRYSKAEKTPNRNHKSSDHHKSKEFQKSTAKRVEKDIEEKLNLESDRKDSKILKTERKKFIFY